jgi:hypothetical protein
MNKKNVFFIVFFITFIFIWLITLITPSVNHIIKNLTLEDKLFIINELKTYLPTEYDERIVLNRDDLIESAFTKKYRVHGISASYQRVVAFCIANDIGARYSFIYTITDNYEILKVYFEGNDLIIFQQKQDMP